MKSIRLVEGKERSLLRRHPWVFAGSVARGKADPGETVRVEAHDGRFLCWAAFSPSSILSYCSRDRCPHSGDVEAGDRGDAGNTDAASIRDIRQSVAGH